MKLVVGAPVVEVVAEAGNHHSQHLFLKKHLKTVQKPLEKYLNLAKVVPPCGGGEDGEHELADVEGVSPVVIIHLPVVFLHCAQPSGRVGLSKYIVSLQKHCI